MSFPDPNPAVLMSGQDLLPVEGDGLDEPTGGQISAVEGVRDRGERGEIEDVDVVAGSGVKDVIVDSQTGDVVVVLGFQCGHIVAMVV